MRRNAFCTLQKDHILPPWVLFMIPITDFRKLLGNAAGNLTDAEVEEIRAHQYRLADAVFDLWLHERNAKKNTSLKTPILSCIITTNTTSASRTSF